MLTKTRIKMLKEAGVNNEVLATILNAKQLELAFIGELPKLNKEKYIKSDNFLSKLSSSDKKATNLREINVDYRWEKCMIYINCRFDLVDKDGTIVKENKYDWFELDLEDLEDYLIWPSDREYKLQA